MEFPNALRLRVLCADGFFFFFKSKKFTTNKTPENGQSKKNWKGEQVTFIWIRLTDYETTASKQLFLEAEWAIREF